ncbi:MAG: hypothetical protein ACJA0Q_000711 [Saprospiraceae bacterium]|jgi:hypothetical protein
MIKHFYFLIPFVFLLNSQIGLSQCMEKPTGNKKIAKNYMTFGQYTCALEELLIIYLEKPDKVFLNRAIAECYAGIPGLEKKGVKYGEFLLDNKKFTPEDLWILTIAYHKNHQFKKSIETANKYIVEFKPVELELEGVQKLIGHCEHALEITKFPTNIKFENLGKKINSKWGDLNPMPTANESQLIFTTSRKTVMGGYSFGNAYLPDLYLSKFKGKKYSKPRSLGAMFNSIDIDMYAGSSDNNRYLFLSTDAEGFQIFNLKMSYLKPKARSWPKPVSVTGINSNTSNEKSATVNNEGNIIIFSSDRVGGHGGYDLWMSRKLPDGNWGEPVNLGPQVNTIENETFAMFNEFQNGIFFASEGHLSMGGYDIFESLFSEDFATWTTPQNLGYPVNTVYDDFSVKFLQKRRLAYKSDYRDDSYGMSDLYRLVFLDSTPQLSILNVNLKTDEATRLSIDSLTALRNISLTNLDSLRTLHASLNPSKADSIDNEVVIYDEDGFDIGYDSTLTDSIVSLQIDSVLDMIVEQNEKIQQTNPNCYAKIMVSNSSTEEEYGTYKSNSFRGGILMILEPGKYDLSVVAKGYYPLNKSLIIYDKNKFKKFINKDYTLRKRK